MPIKEIHEKPITVIQVNTIIDMVHVVVIIIITNLKKIRLRQNSYPRT